MFVDDRVQYPMTFVVQFEFAGNLNRQAFQSAIDQALPRHPLLTSVIRPAKSSRDCWVPAECRDSQVVWGDLTDPIYVDGTGEFIDLREETGFRCWCRHDRERAIATFAFHHAACDGIGAYQFLGEVLWFYAWQMGADELPPLPTLVPADLRKRLRANISAEVADAFGRQGEAVGWRRAQPLFSPGHPMNSAGAHRYPAFHTRTYEKSEFRELRLRAQDSGQTTNDRLLESLFVAMCSWNRRQAGAQIDRNDFCVNMPLDLRRPGLPPFSAINLVTSALVRRTTADIQDRDGLVRSLCEEAMALKHSRLNSEFMRTLVSLPVDLKAKYDCLDDGNCHATVVFSNTGDPTRRFNVELPRERGMIRAGNLLLEDINGTPPLRSQTRAAISVFTYRRRLRICFRFDPRHFTDRGGEEFVQHFADCFTELAPARAG